MAFRVPEPELSASRINARSVIIETCGAYEQTADEYARATFDYDDYPGLKGEVVKFEAALPEHLPVLDLGCGGGRDGRLLASLGRRVIMSDFSAAMLRSARKLSTDQDNSMSYARLNSLALPFSTSSLGGVWASGSLLHLPRFCIPSALSEMLRVLAASGVAAISMRAGTGEGWREGGTLAGRRWFTLVDPTDFSAVMSALGFSDVKIRVTGRQDWFVAVGRKPSVR